MTLVWIAIGGGVGAALRYLAQAGAVRLLGVGFPYGTLFVNVLGSLLMGLAAALLVERLGPGRGASFLTAGVLGGFTTFSTFSLDAVALAEAGRLPASAVYVAASAALSIGALVLGLALGRAAT